MFLKEKTAFENYSKITSCGKDPHKTRHELQTQKFLAWLEHTYRNSTERITWLFEKLAPSKHR